MRDTILAILTSFLFVIIIPTSALAAVFDPPETIEQETRPVEALTSRQLGRWLNIAQKPDKPGQSSVDGYSGDDTCQWANDGECDDPGIGTGACSVGTDYSDCWRIATQVEDDSCQWANDGECDEPGFGTGACTQATDLTDCGEIIDLRFRNDSCETAFDDVCNEPETGDGSCAARSDRADCIGRDRPLTINDHYFGHDDRVFLDTSVFPWNVIGQIDLDAGGACTATLIANDILVTAAHCINEDGVTDATGTFTTAYAREGGALSANIIGYMLDPEWNEAIFSASDEHDGTDWALLRIDQPLGETLGHVGVGLLADYLEFIGEDAPRTSAVSYSVATEPARTGPRSNPARPPGGSSIFGKESGAGSTSMLMVYFMFFIVLGASVGTVLVENRNGRILGQVLLLTAGAGLVLALQGNAPSSAPQDTTLADSQTIDAPEPALPSLEDTALDVVAEANTNPPATSEGTGEAEPVILVQAGYSWDTGAHLSGNIDCRIITSYDDHTMAHNCDTTRGDSGSPFMVRAGGEYLVIATDSNFRSNPDGPMLYIAAQSSAWAHYVEDFVAGRIGEASTRPSVEGKPDK